MKIPKIIYQTHFDLFSDLKPLTRSWKQYHPDYEYHFYNDQMCDEFIKNFSDRVYQAYKTINIGAVKSDLWRYCVLYRTGGVYIDSDTLCRQNITNMLANYEFVSAIDSWFFSKNIFQGFLASVPGHPLLRKVIDQVVYHIENIMFERTTTENHNVIALSGPECFGRVLNRHLERPDKTLFYPGVVKNMLLIQHRPWVKDSLLYNEKEIALCQQLGNCYSSPNSKHYSQIINLYKPKRLPIWSKGYGAITHMPKRYWCEIGAEDKRSLYYVRELVMDLDATVPKGEVLKLYLKISSSKENNDVSKFITFMNKMGDRKFIIISTDGDNNSPSSVANYELLLSNSNLVRWYTQNYDGTVEHPKLKAIPIGLDLHTYSKRFEEMAALKEMYFQKERTGIVLDCMAESSIDRSIVKQAVSKNSMVTKLPKMNQGELWKQYCTYKYGISPRGNGLDCHRTWEMLYFGMIPIVKTSPLDILYDGLPVVIIKEWEFLKQIDWLKEIDAKTAECWFIDYWIRGSMCLWTQE